MNKKTKKYLMIILPCILTIMGLSLFLTRVTSEETITHDVLIYEFEKQYTLPSVENEIFDGTEFITDQTGFYTVGEHVQEGTYDLIAENSRGNLVVKGAGDFGRLKVNEMIGTQEDRFYVTSVNNVKLETGDLIETKGVSIKLAPKGKIVKTDEQKVTLKYVYTEVDGINTDEVNECKGCDEGITMEDLSNLFPEIYDQFDIEKVKDFKTGNETKYTETYIKKHHANDTISYEYKRDGKKSDKVTLEEVKKKFND